MASRGKAQRIAIWIIAIVLTVGTIGSFLVIILSNNNAQLDQTRIDQLQEQYQSDYDNYEASLATKTKKLSDKYFDEFNKYSGRVGKFDAASVNELETIDLKDGDGSEVKSESTVTTYYIGWTPDGKTFDSSIDGTKLKAPLAIPLSSLIEGWGEGLSGMRVGGVRELTIPSELAYGETGSANIKPNEPIKFVVMVIPPIEGLEEPEIPQELLDYYQKNLY